MFERYTERARRVIFFARYEASQFGHTKIESVHLLLGLLREATDLIQRILPAIPPEKLRRQVEHRVTVWPKISAAIELPVSDECKRILAFAYEESERLKQSFIGTEHLLVGLLREENCLAARILTEEGLKIAEARDQLAGAQGTPASRGTVEGPLDRSAVHALVDQLPESMLARAHWMLSQLL